MPRFYTVILSALVAIIPLAATEVPDSVAPDSSAVTEVKKKNIINKIIDYFDSTNKESDPSKFDFSVIGGPHYSSDTKFGIGLVAAGQYRNDTVNLELPPSDVSLYLDATTSMFFKIGVSGNNIFKNDRSRLQYDVNVSQVTTKFWGIGYDMDVDDANESKYKYVGSQATVSYVWRVAPNLYIGPEAALNFINARERTKPELWEGQNHATFNLGVGFTLQYDTRDCITCAWHGALVRLDQMFLPRAMFNKSAFSMTELRADYFHPLWHDATIAYEFHTRLTYGNTPWSMLGTLGGSHNMRGYFEGRYRDKCEADVCVELRQHIWHRNGIVAWVGAGTVFPKFSALRFSKILPNYGIGYRWEFKKRVNVRLDLGFGRHQTGFIFSINEAF
ncbi:MAG: BamA/TamA family outer membrane protein [Bacteroidales bacterium]|nr:BamA/TamA family outer membrane protein [Bacteroidales bacterium]